MIDIERQIYTKIFDLVSADYPNADILNETILIPSNFPCVCVEEIGNSTVRATQDSSHFENHANIDYEINVYTNDSMKKVTCREIVAKIDDLLLSIGFTRQSASPVNMADGTMYRMVCRYTCVVSTNEIIYRR